jgi:para-aminobenzoate synthetase component 1
MPRFPKKQKIMSILATIEKMNALAAQKVPYIFIIDYSTQHAIIMPISEINPNEIQFSVNGFNNIQDTENNALDAPLRFQKFPISLEEYSQSFGIIMDNLQKGNSYLSNLTCETHIETSLSLKQIFIKSKAPYKLWYNNQFVVFSPEIFIKIQDGKIMSFPMKGTIDANFADAEKKILENKKEMAEHATIVDLIRNDLSKVAAHVKVDRYRYFDRIKTNEGELLQVSSQISGDLPKNYRQNLGSILFELLPAGSICGAPKKKTLEIIASAEKHIRGFYTGVFGIFDGKNLDSAVMIRFIENINGKLIYKSGGGITANSVLEDEYNEMIQKVYLPF